MGARDGRGVTALWVPLGVSFLQRSALGEMILGVEVLPSHPT